MCLIRQESLHIFRDIFLPAISYFMHMKYVLMYCSDFWSFSCQVEIAKKKLNYAFNKAKSQTSVISRHVCRYWSGSGSGLKRAF